MGTPEDRIAWLESKVERLETLLARCEEYILDHPSGDDILEAIYEGIE
jgi:hypothetical protein